MDLAYCLLPLPRTCLNESLTLYGLLRRHGIDARFRIGVRKEGARLAAHAWIEGKDTLPEIDPRVRLKPDTTERIDESYLTLPIPEQPPLPLTLTLSPARGGEGSWKWFLTFLLSL